MVEEDMETTFARWLRKRGEAHHVYAKRMGLGYISVARLIGIGREPQEIKRFSFLALTKVSADTGIPIQTLIDDAVKAARNPVEPRKYVKKGMDDGKAAAAE